MHTFMWTWKDMQCLTVKGKLGNKTLHSIINNLWAATDSRPVFHCGSTLCGWMISVTVHMHTRRSSFNDINKELHASLHDIVYIWSECSIVSNQSCQTVAPMFVLLHCLKFNAWCNCCEKQVCWKKKKNNRKVLAHQTLYVRRKWRDLLASARGCHSPPPIKQTTLW